jgi:hypothetical protein
VKKGLGYFQFEELSDLKQFEVFLQENGLQISPDSSDNLNETNIRILSKIKRIYNQYAFSVNKE